MDSLIYTVAFANEDFSISQQDTFTWLCIGIKDADEQQQKKVAEVAEILKGADIDYKDPGRYRGGDLEKVYPQLCL